MDLAVIEEKEEENETSEDVVLGEANQDDYDEVVESAKSTETKNAQATGEDEEIFQNKDFSAAKGISKNSADLTLEDSIASLALHDLVKIGNSTEFLIPVKGILSVDPFQIYSETNLDNPAHMSLCLSLEVPSSTDNHLCNEEENKQGTLQSENQRGHLAAATCEGNKNAFLGNQWTDSFSRFSPSLETLACSFSPATPSETWNPQSGEPDITSLTCVAAAETAEVGGNEMHSEWSQSLVQFSPSLEAFAHSLSTITPKEIGSPHSGKQEVMLLPWTAFEPLLQKENCNHSTKWTSHPALSRRCSHETEDTSTAADTFIIGSSQNHSGNQNGVLRDHTGGHSRTSKRISTADSDVLVEAGVFIC